MDGLRVRIRELLEEGVPTEEVAQQLGVPRGSVSAVKAHLTMGSYRTAPPRVGTLNEVDVVGIDEATSLQFRLERDMQAAIRRNIHQLDLTLNIVDGGKERRVASASSTSWPKTSRDPSS